MEETTSYAWNQPQTTFKSKVINGEKTQKEEFLLPFTIDYLECVLQEEFGNVRISENPWSRKQGTPSYDLFISVGKSRTMVQIQTYLDSRFQERPLGGHRNFTGSDLANLFVYYKVAQETFYLKFSDVIPSFIN